MSSSDSDREVIDILTNSSENEEDNRRVRIYKERVNYLATLDSYEFQVRFRLDKESTEQLLLVIYPHIRVTGSRYKQNHGISPLHQLLMTLLCIFIQYIYFFISTSRATSSLLIAFVFYRRNKSK
ncbi:hypothetical protein ACJJTC_013950 [Scirpophaga incertulas]